MPLTVFCDTEFPGDAASALRDGLAQHRVLYAVARERSNLVARAVDPAFQQADVAFGQPPVAALLGALRLRWVQLTTAGYTRYDTPEIRRALADKGVALTTSSAVYADPCAEHCLAMMLSMARRLPESLDAQRGDRGWKSATLRARSVLLRGQSVLLLGHGAIGKRLAELLAPFEVRLTVLRRRGTGDARGMIDARDLDRALAEADHIVDVLPENDGTRGLVSAERLARVRDGAFFYNVGRGATVDEGALRGALHSGKLGGAYLDVTVSEPLPAEHPLWSAPNCYVTPHSAGGRRDEALMQVRHFLENLRRFERGERLADEVWAGAHASEG